MSRPASLSADHRARLVLQILEGKTTIVDAARREGIATNTVSRWKSAFIDGGTAALASNPSGHSSREAALETQIAELTSALGEAYMAARRA